MKSIIKLSAAALAIAAIAQPILAVDSPVKREMRSAWVATVWRLDWPSTTISSTGNATQIAKQKQDLVTLLDSMAVNNMNAINFQVRSRADAMYKSSYEPWSSDLVSTRGMDPGWDPLEYCVEECHKRGIECHAWVNPYRFESSIGQWSGLAGDYRTDHPDWLLDVEGHGSILNPGLPEVTQRICDVISEIVKNYDVDGVLFDDYFYLSGTAASQDADLYNAYKADGGTLSQNDWRRDNVNRMVKSVYTTIKSIKPWVRFGISPAGIACTSSSVAAKYGISPCPTGSDWQYNDIYSDPIAWISQQSIDFISPQIYWTIGHTTDYDKASKWWSEIADHYNRHFYSSHSISSLTASSKAPAMMSQAEMNSWESTIQPLASGPNNTSFSEYADEVRLNREYTLNDAPGSIFYSAKYLYKTAPLFAHYLKTTVFNTHALLPALTWQAVSHPGNVSDVKKNGSTLTWTGREGVRYTVYAVPTSIDQQNFNREPEYLLGVSYDESYSIPSDKLSGYNYAVCTYDRYGNEYSPVFVGANTQTLTATTLLAPANGSQCEMPFEFKWSDVANASSYIVEIASDKDMTNLLYTRAVNATSLSTNDLPGLTSGQTLYWRVRSCGNSYDDGISAVNSVTTVNLEISSPEDLSQDVSLTPTIKWNIAERKVTVEVASDDTFENIVFSAEGNGGSVTVPKYLLSGYTQYFVRANYQVNGESCTTKTVSFTTKEVQPAAPAIANPVNGGDLYANDHISISLVEGVKNYRLEVASSTAFTARSSYITTLDMTGVDSKRGDAIKLGSTALKDGNTYYARVRASYANSEGTQNTDYSDAVSFTYHSQESGVNDITADASASALRLVKDGVSTSVVVNFNGHAVVKAYTSAGSLVTVLLDSDLTAPEALPLSLPAGVYIITLNDQTSLKVVL